MKIPDTSANVGAYYGNQENGQWQPNGVIIDNGVGGGVVGSGDAGLHRPPIYPIHIPRGHIPGYVMAGAYYPPAYPPVPQPQDDFEDYMWMENEEEFDKQVMQQLEEEALMEQCIEAMLEDEQREKHHRPVANGHSSYPTTSNGSTVSLEEAVSKSTLNPLAAEFVPTCARLPPPPEDKKELPPETPAALPEDQRTEDSIDTTEKKEEPSQVIEDVKTEEPPTTDPPEVSAAGVPTETKRPKETKKDVKKPEVKKSVKPEPKKVVKSETKVVPKKKEVKAVKSEIKVEDEEVTVDIKPQLQHQPSPPPEETQSQTPEFKPINYAAAAKANKPKRASSPPLSVPIKTEKTKTEKPKTEKVEKKEKATTPKPKTEKVVPRKNSTK